MGLNYFIFNGKSSLDFGVYIGGQGTYDAPQRDISKVSIPGRNGDLIMDNGRYLNIQVSYPIVVMNEFKDKTDAIRQWLLQPTTYVALEDTYHPNEYRLAVVTGGLSFETSAFNQTGKTTVTFDCKPQRFLKSGDVLEQIEGKSGQISTGYLYNVIKNPTVFPSKPIIRIYLKDPYSHEDITGDKVVSIDGTPIQILSGIPANLNIDYIDVDTELMDCYHNNTNCNRWVYIDGDFPIIKSEGSDIMFTENLINAVWMKGRWWTV